MMGKSLCCYKGAGLWLVVQDQRKTIDQGLILGAVQWWASYGVTFRAANFV